jgi:hypothetical protein
MVLHFALEVHDGIGSTPIEGNFLLSSEIKALTAAARAEPPHGQLPNADVGKPAAYRERLTRFVEAIR